MDPKTKNPRPAAKDTPWWGEQIENFKCAGKI